MSVTWKAMLGKHMESRLWMAFGAIGLGLLIAVAVLVTEAIWQPWIILGGALLVWLFISRPDVGLAILVFVVYTRFSDVLEKFHGLPSFVLPLALLLLGVVLWRWWVNGERMHNWEVTAVVLGAFALVGFTSLLYAADPGRSLNALIEFIKNGVLLFAVFMALRHPRSLRYTVWALVAAGIFMGTITVYQQLTGTFENIYWGFGQTEVKNIVGSVTDYRVAGPVGAPNFYAMILVVLVPVALNRVWYEKKTSLRLLALWALVVCLLSIVFTFSRGGFLALAVVLLWMWARHSFKLRQWILGLALLVLVWQFLPANYTERLSTTLDLLPGSEANARNEVSFRGRTSEVMVAWLIFTDHPLLGVGLNNYKTFYQEYAQPLGWDNRREERSAHNLYLETAAETGLVGLLTFGVILAVTFKGAYRAQKGFMRRGQYDEASMSWALAIGLAGYLIASIFLHGAYARYFWLLVGVLLALPHIATLPAAAPRPYQQPAFSPVGVLDAE